MSIPESIIAIITSRDPVVRSHASGALIVFKYHCWGNAGSLGIIAACSGKTNRDSRITETILVINILTKRLENDKRCLLSHRFLYPLQCHNKRRGSKIYAMLLLLAPNAPK